MRLLNNAGPWWGMTPPGRLTIADLIRNGTIPPEPAGALWWALERGASLFVAAMPRLAGKTTLATALLPFLPEGVLGYVTSGPRDPLMLAQRTPPIYLLINELSDHSPVYLSGEAAARAFALLRKGHRVIGTLHANSAAGAVDVMHAEAAIPMADIAHVTLVAVLSARRTERAIERRVVEIGLLTPEGEGVAVATLAARGASGLGLYPHAAMALGAWAGATTEEAQDGIAARAAALATLARQPSPTTAAIAALVRSVRAGTRPADGSITAPAGREHAPT